MKKPLLLSLMLFLGLSVYPLTACGGSNDGESNDVTTPEHKPSKPKDPIKNDSELPTEIVPLGEPGIQIHYQRIEGSYKDWGLWLWAEGKDGIEYKFNYADDYGVIAYYPLTQFGNPKSLGFIVKKLFSVAGDGVWVKDGDYDRFMDIEMLKADENETYHVYIRSKMVNVFTDAKREHVMNAVTECQFETNKKISLKANNPIEEPVVKKNGEIVTNLTVDNELKLSKPITLGEAADVSDNYTIDITFRDGGFVTKNVSIRKLYDEAFDQKYYYDGELGAIYSKEKTTFRVWSPISSDIKLRIYSNGTPTKVSADKGDDTYIEHVMNRDKAKGIFEYTIDGDLAGKYYTYVVTNGYNPKGKEIVDPYAKSAGVNGLRGMIVDFDVTNPTGWENVEYNKVDKKHLTVYETHVSDLTSSATWNGTPENAKKFNGMIEEGTTYTEGDVTVKTGFDHVKELGVNAVQVIPFFDQSNDEVNMKFNWGYNPLNYNVVEGGYSSDPYDGYVRIRELKEVIKTYKENGMAFIMDVVYNHVNGLAGSNFDVLMPFYYFRYSETGGASSGSGCGNDTASERAMFSKFMVDSTSFWQKEYKLDGYRFDLMGLHDVETMNKVMRKLRETDPNVTVYGEAWVMGTSTSRPVKLANQKNAGHFDNFGQFNDQGRDAIMAGGMSPAESKGWMNSEKNPVRTKAIVEMLKGQTENVTSDPNKSVNYVACHDNYTLHDRNIAAGIYDEEKIANSNIIANSLVLTSQGVSFMLSGDEINRTKIEYDKEGNPVVDETVKDQVVYKVSHNSYSSSYKTNEIDWALKVKNLHMFECYQKLINLKKNVSDLGLNEAEIHASKTFSVNSERDGTIIKSTFSDEQFDYVAYYTCAALYNYGEDKTPYVLDIENKDVYLATRHNITNEKSIELKPCEAVILRTAKNS